MLIVNLFGGPGSGKSTTAAQAFGYAKMAGLNCELVTEFAKDMTWDGSTSCLGYQPYVFGQQAWRLERLRNKVDVVFTDSPLLLSLVYAPEALPRSFRDFVAWEHARSPSLNYRLQRVKPYNPVGRNQTEEAAKALDGQIADMLREQAVSHELVTGDGTAPVRVFADTVRRLEALKGEVFSSSDLQAIPNLWREACPQPSIAAVNQAYQHLLNTQAPLPSGPSVRCVPRLDAGDPGAPFHVTGANHVRF